MAANVSTGRTISVPLPTHRLAHAAFRALKVDAELSPLVKRSFSLASSSYEGSNGVFLHDTGSGIPSDGGNSASDEEVPGMNGHAATERPRDSSEHLTVLKTEYRATTNRMLRVAVNGFMESLGVVLGVMAELDVDVLAEKG